MAVLPVHNPDPTLAADEEKLAPGEIVSILEGYRQEAEINRKTGDNARDEVWQRNVDLYWNRFDFSKKAEWQAKEVMPEAPMFVDRFAAALREALNQAGTWYTVEGPGDTEGDVAQIIKKVMDIWLKRCGRNQLGQPMDFSGVFEEQMKLGAMMAASAVVTWKAGQEDQPGYVSVEAVDPRFVWMDHTGRGLYRRRRYEIDKHELVGLANLQDANGENLYDMEEIARLTAMIMEEDRRERDRISGHASDIIATGRKPVQIDEWLCTLVRPDGEIEASNALCVVANERALIRGPEPNPFAHKRDWLVYCPLITVPLSPYGRSYMENWGGVAKAFIEMTNLILDATFTHAMNAYAMQPDMLEDPTQASEGVHPNVTFMLEPGSDLKQFLTAIELGDLPPEALRIWQALKQELQEGAAFSEIALGQLSTGEKTATEIVESGQGSSALIRSIARTVEVRFLEQILNLVWKTGLEHLEEQDREMQAAIGPEAFQMLLQRRQEFIRWPITFQVHGISGVIDRTQKLRNLMQALQIIGQSDILLQAFLQRFPAEKVMEEILVLLGVDMAKLSPTDRERRVAEMLAAMQQQMQAALESQAKAQPPDVEGTRQAEEGTKQEAIKLEQEREATKQAELKRQAGADALVKALITAAQGNRNDTGRGRGEGSQ